jgi:hypothetical protein
MSLWRVTLDGSFLVVSFSVVSVVSVVSVGGSAEVQKPGSERCDTQQKNQSPLSCTRIHVVGLEQIKHSAC